MQALSTQDAATKHSSHVLVNIWPYMGAAGMACTLTFPLYVDKDKEVRTCFNAIFRHAKS